MTDFKLQFMIKIDVRRFDSFHDILRSLNLAQSVLKGQNSPIWRSRNRWVKRSLGLISDFSYPIQDPRSGSPLAWVDINPATNGDDQESDFHFRAFRFASSMTMYMHCDSKLFYNSEEDLTVYSLLYGPYCMVLTDIFQRIFVRRMKIARPLVLLQDVGDEVLRSKITD